MFYQFLTILALSVLSFNAHAQVKEEFTEIQCYSDNDPWSDNLRIYKGPAGTLKAEASKSDVSYGPVPCKTLYTGVIFCAGFGGVYDGSTGEKLNSVTITIQKLNSVFSVSENTILNVTARNKKFVANHIANVTVVEKTIMASEGWSLICN